MYKHIATVERKRPPEGQKPETVSDSDDFKEFAALFARVIRAKMFTGKHVAPGESEDPAVVNNSGR